MIESPWLKPTNSSRKKTGAHRAFVAIILCGWIATACRTMPPAIMDPAQEHLTVLTYNVNFATPNPELTLRSLARSTADVLCLQETGSRWWTLFDQTLAGEYPHRFVFPGEGVAGMAILSRFELANRRVLAPEAGWFPAQVVDVRSPIGTIQVMNVHLRPSLSERGSVSLSAVYRVPAVRQQEIRSFFAEAAPDRPAILVGDFNSGDGGQAIAWLRERGFADALRLYDRTSSTWRYRWGGIRIGGRFDHILFSRELRCLGAKVLEFGASDHRPVIATLIRNDMQGAGRSAPENDPATVPPFPGVRRSL